MMTLLLIATPTLSTKSASSMSSPCTTDDDCSLNGLCDVRSGVCACDPWWEGKWCQRLVLLPAKRYAGKMDYDTKVNTPRKVPPLPRLVLLRMLSLPRAPHMYANTDGCQHLVVGRLRGA
jgi:hypothetical protein